MKRFEYFVGVLPEDKQRLQDMLTQLTEISEPSMKIKKLYEFDDPNGYYTWAVEGTEANYSMFLSMTRHGEASFIKSINHYQQD